MGYANIQCYVMSGTGNGWRAARQLHASSQAAGVPCAVTPINHADPPAEIGDDPQHLLGLIYPVHGFTAPWAMIRFALRLPRRRGTHAFLMVPRGASAFWHLYVPGFEGTAGYLIAAMLLAKGYRVRGVIGLDLPANWLTVHPGMNHAHATELFARTERKVDDFVTDILAGRTRFSVASVVCLLLGLLLARISFIYLIIGRLMLAKMLFAGDRCTGCGLCAKHCPEQAIRLGENRPYWTFTCESCMRCIAFCPTRAIEGGYVWVALVIACTSLPVVDLAIRAVRPVLPALGQLLLGLLTFLLTYIFTLACGFLCYLALYLLARQRLVNFLLSRLTFTRWFRRYHAPEVTAQELNEPLQSAPDPENRESKMA
jgi:Pyruvate/2-oxoacid:ferredoxin oxidoreductase delta subunit